MSTTRYHNIAKLALASELLGRLEEMLTKADVSFGTLEIAEEISNLRAMCTGESARILAEIVAPRYAYVIAVDDFERVMNDLDKRYGGISIPVSPFFSPCAPNYPPTDNGETTVRMPPDMNLFAEDKED